MASWCGYCAQSLPTLKDLKDQYPDLGLVVVTIDDKPAGALAELKKVRSAGLDVPVLQADPVTRAAWLGPSGSVPRYVFINGDGRIVAQDKGFGDKVRPLMPGQARRALRRASTAPSVIHDLEDIEDE